VQDYPELTGEVKVLQTTSSPLGTEQSETAGFRFLPARIKATLFRSDPFRRNIVHLGGGTALGQLLVVAATPVLTRLYNPVDFALAGLLLGFVSFAGVATGLRYDLAIVDARTKTDANLLLVATLLAVFPVSLLAGAVYLFLIYNHILTYQQLPPASVAFVIPVLLFSGVFVSCRFWHARAENFRAVSHALVLQGAGRALLPIILWPMHIGWAGLIAGDVAGRALGTGKIVAQAIRTLRSEMSSTWVREIGPALQRYWRYPAIMLPSSLIDSLLAFLPLPLISTLFGSTAAGEFVLVTRVGSLPLGLIVASVSDVYHARMADTFRNDPKKVEHVFKEVAAYLCLISVVIYVPVMLLSPFIFGPLFGSKWQTAGYLTAVMAPSLAIQLVSSPLTRTFNVLGYQSWKLAFDVPRVALPLVALWLGHHLGYNFTISLALFAGASICVEALVILVVWRAARAVAR
jgi:O-antigen/teichoic acid export membrane protein